MSMSMGYSVGTSVSEDVNNSFHKLYVDPLLCCTSFVNGNNTVNDVKTCLTKFLNIQDNDDDDDDKQTSSSFIPSNNNNSSSLPLSGVENQDICQKKEEVEPLHSDKCLTKSATFAGPVESMDYENVAEIEDDNNVVIAELITDFESVKPFHAYPQSLLAPSKKLVSSMKGGRAKPLEKKMNVTWAPDVYDPVPTAVSHLLTNKNQRHHHHRSSTSSSKKHGKSSKHKGSSGKTSRSTAKDKKKQSHRAAYGGGGGSSSSRCFKDERVHGGDFFESNSSVDFDVGDSPESYCGTSFLKETLVSKLHFSVAEAT